MPSELPPTLSPRTKLVVGVVLVATLAYSFVIAGQILLWFLFAGIVAGTYIAWLFVLAFFRLVEAIERLAAAKEAEVGSADRSVEAERIGDNSPNRSDDA